MASADEAAGRAVPHSQTLDRGIRVLETLAEAEQPLAVAQLAAVLGVHRSIVYRIVRTLEDHRLVTRRPDGLYELGTGLATLARSVSRDLQSAALPDLADVANDTGMTAFLAVADQDECVTLLTVEPRHAQAHVAYRPGARHPIDRGAPGLALLAAGPPRPGERPEVAEARERGYARSTSEVIPGLSSVAVPLIAGRERRIAAVAVVFVSDGSVDEDALGRRLRQAAANIAAELP